MLLKQKASGFYQMLVSALKKMSCKARTCMGLRIEVQMSLSQCQTNKSCTSFLGSHSDSMPSQNERYLKRIQTVKHVHLKYSANVLLFEK